MTETEYLESLYSRIKVLNETVWEDRVRKHNVDSWLSNFQDDEKLHALHLLSEFMYFGSTQMRQLLIALYRDYYRYRIIKEIRINNNDTLDPTLIEQKFNFELSKTRFIGVGNPSESGAYLLYFFRQENKLPKRLFIHTEEIFFLSQSGTRIRDNTIKNYVFIDDFCGSGSQVNTYLKQPLKNIKSFNPNAKLYYLILSGTTQGINFVKSLGVFDDVNAVVEFDETFKCFAPNSRHFDSSNPFQDVNKSKSISFKYGLDLAKAIILLEKPSIQQKVLDIAATRHALGFNDCQLLLGFHHNTPDNTLPTIWFDEETPAWIPIFKRYNKIYF